MVLLDSQELLEEYQKIISEIIDSAKNTEEKIQEESQDSV